MKAFNALCWLFLVLLAFGVVARMNVVKVEIGHTGVLTKEWGEGLVQKDYGPGYHWDMGPLHNWDTFDTTVQTLSFNRHNSRQSSRGRRGRSSRSTPQRSEGPLMVKSADGSTVTLDVTIKYQIRKGECWLLRKEMGTGDSYKVKVRNEAIDALRPVFGKMKNEEFYVVGEREKRAEEAEVILRERLKRLHVDTISILIRDLSFDKDYEEKIRKKTESQQKSELNKSETLVKQFAGETDTVKAETEARVTVINQELERQRRELTAENEVAIAKIRADAERFALEQRSDADLYVAEKEADGALLVKNAEAEGQFLRQQSLSGPGAGNLIALEAAQNLNLTKLQISTLATNFIDLGKLAELLGATKSK